MFKFPRAFRPFFQDAIAVSCERSGAVYSFSANACVTSGELVDAMTGAPCADRSWSVVVPFGSWLGPSDPQVGDTIRYHAADVVLRVSRVERDRSVGEYLLTCSERAKEVRRGFGR